MMLRHDEHRNAGGARRRVRQSRQHEMHDIVGKIMIAVGDEDLLARNPISSVPRRRRLRAQFRKIGARLGFGQVHRAGPLAGNKLRQIGPFLIVRTRMKDRLDSPGRQRRADGEGHRGAVQRIDERDGERLRQPLPAPFLGKSERVPAALDISPVGFLEAGARSHDAVLEARGGAVAVPVQGRDDAVAELGGLADDRLGDVRRQVRIGA